MLSLRIERQVKKEFKKIHPKHAQQIAKKIQELRNTPYPQDSKALQGYENIFRADIGEYRIVYRAEGNRLLLILCLGKRNDDEVYRFFKRYVGF